MGGEGGGVLACLAAPHAFLPVAPVLSPYARGTASLRAGPWEKEAQEDGR